MGFFLFKLRAALSQVLPACNGMRIRRASSARVMVFIRQGGDVQHHTRLLILCQRPIGLTPRANDVDFHRLPRRDLAAQALQAL